MPTSDERCEVAERLRKDVGESSCIDYAVFRIAHDMLGIEHVSGAKAAHMLADLIDPTCHVVGTIAMDWSDGLTVYNHELSCGHICCTDWPEPPRYCQYCGARVVSE